MPDFFTLYLVVLLLNLSHCLIWGMIAYRYRDLGAARYWLAGSAASVAGGAALSFQGESGLMLFTVAGNSFVILGFYLNWCGAKRLHGDKIEWLKVLALAGGSVLLMLATFHLWYGRNPVYTLAHSVPLWLTAVYMMQPSRRDLGAIVTGTAMIAGGLSHGIIAGGNVLIVTGLSPDLQLYRAASIDLLVFLFAGVIWNFGFLISAFDRLRTEVERLANEDELTGIANRRMFMSHLNRISGTGHDGAIFSLLLFDLDRFKGINDKHGHAAGDAALRHVAAVIARHLRQGDVFARLGGDEFSLLLPRASAAEAAVVAKRIVNAVRGMPMLWEDRPLTLTISIGITSSEGFQTDPATLLDLADRALYETKRRGRNGYAIYSAASDGAANITRLGDLSAVGSAAGT